MQGFREGWKLFLVGGRKALERQLLGQRAGIAISWATRGRGIAHANNTTRRDGQRTAAKQVPRAPVIIFFVQRKEHARVPGWAAPIEKGGEEQCSQTSRTDFLLEMRDDSQTPKSWFQKLGEYFLI